METVFQSKEWSCYRLSHEDITTHKTQTGDQIHSHMSDYISSGTEHSGKHFVTSTKYLYWPVPKSIRNYLKLAVMIFLRPQHKIACITSHRSQTEQLEHGHSGLSNAHLTAAAKEGERQGLLSMAASCPALLPADFKHLSMTQEQIILRGNSKCGVVVDRWPVLWVKSLDW